MADYGPKYLVGNEMGSIISLLKKPKRNAEINLKNSFGIKNQRNHLGPVYRI